MHLVNIKLSLQRKINSNKRCFWIGISVVPFWFVSCWLTVTNVVFEFQLVSTITLRLFRLTVTNVVFECIKKKMPPNGKIGINSNKRCFWIRISYLRHKLYAWINSNKRCFWMRQSDITPIMDTMINSNKRCFWIEFPVAVSRWQQMINSNKRCFWIAVYLSHYLYLSQINSNKRCFWI